MKVLVKAFVAIFLFSCLVLSTLLSSGCSNETEAESSLPDFTRPVSYPDDGELVLPADMNRRIDKNGWENAMKAEQFTNVTITYYNGDVDKTSGSVSKIDGDKSFEISSGEILDASGSYAYKNDMYFYKKNGKNYRVVLTERINQSTGEVINERKKQEDEEFGGMTPEHIVGDEDSLIAFIAPKFDKFIYSDKISMYTARIMSSDYPEADFGDIEIHVGFKDGKLDCIKYKRLNNENATFRSTYFSEYGTTVIEIPEVE